MPSSPSAASIQAILRLTAFCGVAALVVACSNPEVDKVRHFERGNEYAAEGRDEFALIEYASAVRLDPRYGEARLKLAETHERMNNLRAAAPEYIRAADALPDNREAQLKATQILLLAGEFEDAKSRVAALLEKNPQDVDAMLLHANALAALKDPAGALAEIEEAIAVKPDESRTFVNLGAVQMQAGAAKEAEAAFRQAIALDPKSIEAHLALGNFLWSSGRPEEAEAAIEQALAVDPRHLLANRMLGVLYVATSRMAEAERPLKVVAEAAKTPAATLQLADYYISAQRQAEARNLLEELSKQPAGFAEAETRLAALDYTGNRPDEAHKRLDAVMARAPAFTLAHVVKAQWLTDENKLDEALARAQEAVKSDPNSATAHFVLATVHDRRRDIAEATSAYTEVLRLNPRAVAAQVELSRLNLATGDAEEALRLAEDAKRNEPQNVAARLALARTLITRGDLVRAQTELGELQRGLPDTAIVHVLNGHLQMRRADAAAARKSFQRAHELSPGTVEAIAGLAALDVQAKQIPVAINRVEAEIARQGERPSAELLALAAELYGRNGELQKTEQVLRRAVTVDPRFSDGYAMLGRLYVQQKRLDDARVEFEGMVKRDPAAAGPRTMVGMILELQGNRDQARRWYEETLAAVKDAPIAANNLAYIYAEQGINLDMALQLATTAKQGLPDHPDVDDTLGWIHYKKDMPNLAVRPLEESLEKRPDSPEVLYHLGMVHAKLGNEAKARASLQRALELNPNFNGSDVARQTLASFAR